MPLDPDLDVVLGRPDADADEHADSLDWLVTRGPTTTPAPSKAAQSQATQLVRLAEARYRFAQDDSGRSFAVPLDGPLIARPLDGTRSALRSELAEKYFATFGSVARSGALADALSVLDGRAAAADREPLHLRTAPVADGIVIDLGTAQGDAVKITESGVEHLARAPVVFRRTELTSAMPRPTTDSHTLENLTGQLAALVNVTPNDLPLLVGWMIGTLFDIAHPLLFLVGEQGTGKSRAAKTIAQLLDPSPAPLRAAPRDLDAWVVAAAGSQVVALDNLSTIPEWLSDALCRASTGEGQVRRALYTDSALTVLEFRRSIILTAIDAGALRGDLGERLVPVELERIQPDERRTDAELDRLFTDTAPHVLGSLLHLTSQVLATLPDVTATHLPRMADFGKILAALDAVTGWASLPAYVAALAQVEADVVAGDPLASAVLAFMHDRQHWQGSASELLATIATHRPDGTTTWPKTPKALSGTLTRLAPALRSQGITFDRRKSGNARTLTLNRDARDARDGLPSVESEGVKR